MANDTLNWAGIDSEYTPDVDYGALARSTDADAQAAAAYNPTTRSTLEQFGAASVFGLVDLWDTAAGGLNRSANKLTGGAISYNPADYRENGASRAILNALDVPYLTDLYKDTEGAREVGSAIYGVIGSELLTRRITAPAGFLARSLSKVPYIGRLTRLEDEYQVAMQTLRSTDITLAKSGALGMEQYVGAAAVNGQLVSRSALATKARWLSAGSNMTHAAVTEGVMLATLNQNSVLYDDSMAWNATWMLAGVGIGGLLGNFATAYSLRKAGSDADLIRARVEALDPAGIEKGRVDWLKVYDGNTMVDEIAPLSGRQTDLATGLLLERENLLVGEIPEGANQRQLAANREQLGDQKLQQAKEQLNGVTTKGIFGASDTKFATAGGNQWTSGAVASLNRAMISDPTAFYLAEEIGMIPAGKSGEELVKLRADKIEAAIEQNKNKLKNRKLKKEERAKIREQQKALIEKQKLTPMVLLDGEVQPLSEASSWAGFEAPRAGDIEFTQSSLFQKGDRGKMGVWTIKRPETKKTVLAIDQNLGVTMGRKGDSMENLDLFDARRAYMLGSRVIDDIINNAGKVTIPESPNWFQLDMAEELLRRSNGTIEVNFPNGMTRESAMVESFAQKAEAYGRVDLLKQYGKIANVRTTHLTPEQEMARLRMQLNLPRATAYEVGVLNKTTEGGHSLLRGASKYGADAIRKMPLADLKTAIAKLQRLEDLAPTTPESIDMIGNSFSFMQGKGGEAMQPVILMQRPAKPHEWFKDNYVDRVASAQIATRNSLLAASDDYTKALASEIYQNPDAIKATQTYELNELQLQGSLTGSAPMSARGTAANSVLTTDMIARDAPVIQAANRIRDTIDRISGNLTTKLFNEVLGDTLNLLANARNRQSVMLLDNFVSSAPGWEIKRTVAATSQDGKPMFKFELADSEANRSHWRKRYKTEMPKGALLPNFRGTPVVLDDLAETARQRYAALDKLLFQNKNDLLASRGSRLIEYNPYHVTPPTLRDKIIGMTFDPYGKQVPDMTIIASTQADYAKKLQAMQPELDKLGMGYVVRDLESIKRFGNIWDRAAADMIDPGLTAVQPGKRGAGLLNQGMIGGRKFTEVVADLQSEFLAHGRDIIETVFDSSVKAAQARAQVSQALRANNPNRWSKDFRTADDIYLESLLGRSKVKSDKAWVGGLWQAAEGFIDTALKRAGRNPSVVTEATSAWYTRANPWSKTEAAIRDFDSLTEALGEMNPYRSATELLESQGYGKSPLTAAGLVGKASQFSSMMLLRVAEVGHAILNVGGVVANMPSIIRNYTPRLEESSEEFLQRIGHSGMAVKLADGRMVGTLDMNKIMAQGMKFALDKKAHPYYDEMVARGMLSQEVAELQKQYGAIDGRGKWKKFFMGDPTQKDGFHSKGLVGWMSILSDSSEDFSRSVASMTGIRLAQEIGITTRNQQLSFAHSFANQVIANYSPMNRQEVFQGAVGNSIGLFQSYITNYYQRMFRYVETSDWKALRSQMLWQGSVFGVPSMPGFAAIGALHQWLDDDNMDFQKGMQERFGPAGDLLQGGLLSNLPTLFGAPALDLYTRGDVNIRVPGMGLFQDNDKSSLRNLAEIAPAISMMTRIYDGISQSLSAVASSNPGLSAQQLSEILSNTIPNRPIAGMVETFGAGGFDTDRYGQVVGQNQNMMESVYRVLGLKSMRQQEETTAFYASKVAEQQQAGLKEGLRLQMRSAVREGRFEELQDIFFDKYVENGGDPKYWRRTIRETYESALESRGARKLEEVMKNPARAAEMERLLGAGVAIGNDSEEGADAAINMYESMNQPDENKFGLEDEGGEYIDPDTLQPENEFVQM